jgi:hypothetical protein
MIPGSCVEGLALCICRVFGIVMARRRSGFRVFFLFLETRQHILLRMLSWFDLAHMEMHGRGLHVFFGV